MKHINWKSIDALYDIYFNYSGLLLDKNVSPERCKKYENSQSVFYEKKELIWFSSIFYTRNNKDKEKLDEFVKIIKILLELNYSVIPNRDGKLKTIQVIYEVLTTWKTCFPISVYQTAIKRSLDLYLQDDCHQMNHYLEILIKQHCHNGRNRILTIKAIDQAIKDEKSHKNYSKKISYLNRIRGRVNAMKHNR